MKKITVLLTSVILGVIWGVIWGVILAVPVAEGKGWYKNYIPNSLPEGITIENIYLWDGINPTIIKNPENFVVRIGEAERDLLTWNVVVNSKLSEPYVQIWAGYDQFTNRELAIYQILFPSMEGASAWVENPSVTLTDIKETVSGTPWKKPGMGVWHKWLPLSQISQVSDISESYCFFKFNNFQKYVLPKGITFENMSIWSGIYPLPRYDNPKEFLARIVDLKIPDLSWNVKLNSKLSGPGAQIWVNDDGSLVVYQIFFPNKQSAWAWIQNPSAPTPVEIRNVLTKNHWKRPKKGGSWQKWISFSELGY